jgi:hypothetical protein
MPLISCPGCGQQFLLPAEQARDTLTCPDCSTRFTPALSAVPDAPPGKGRRVPRVPVLVTALAAGVLILVVVLMTSGGRRQPGGEDGERGDDRPTVKATAADLWQEYEANSAAADQKYGGRRVQITGTVCEVLSGSVGYEVAEPGVVSMGTFRRMTAQERRWYNEGYPPNVVCEYPAERRATFARAEKGKSFSVVGRCEGSKRDPNVWRGIVVVLTDCRAAR